MKVTTITPEPAPPPPSTVHIELSQHEADMLISLLYRTRPSEHYRGFAPESYAQIVEQCEWGRQLRIELTNRVQP